MSDSTPAPSKQEGARGNGLPLELRQVGESSGKLTSRIEAFAKELTASEARAREAEVAAREAELKALAAARDSLAQARRAKEEAERAKASAATADQRVEAVKTQAADEGRRTRQVEDVEKDGETEEAEDDGRHRREVVDVDLDEIGEPVLRRELFKVDRRKNADRQAKP